MKARPLRNDAIFKRKIYVLTLGAMLYCNAASSQGLLIPDWTKTRVSTLIGGESEAWSVDVDSAGFIYWPVSFDSLNTSKQYETAIYKFDAAGNQLWQSFYVDAGIQHAFICNAPDTFLYVGGRENNVFPYFNTECNMWLLKIDKTTGAITDTLNQGFGTSGYDEMDAIEPRTDGIYCGGWAQVTPGVGNYEMGFLKLDYNLDVLVQNTFGNPAAGHAEHQDGHFVVDDDFVYAAGLWDGHSWINNCCDGRIMLGKFSKVDFSMIDTVLFGPELAAPNDYQNALGITGDVNSLYVTGYAQPATVSDLQMFVAKFDKNLFQQWLTFFGGTDGDVARAIGVRNGLVFVAGGTKSPGYTVGGAYDAFLAVYDTVNGSLVTYKTYGGATDEEFRDLAFHGNDIYLSGTRGTNMFSGGTSDEGFLLKVNLNTVTGISDPAGWDNASFTCYPNPASDMLHIGLDGLFETRAVIEIFDISGRLLIRKIKAVNESGSIDVSALAPAAYVIRVTATGFSYNSFWIRDHE
jgi:hypothetical protein